jgi:hypothetical protein
VPVHVGNGVAVGSGSPALRSRFSARVVGRYGAPLLNSWTRATLPLLPLSLVLGTK